MAEDIVYINEVTPLQAEYALKILDFGNRAGFLFKREDGLTVFVMVADFTEVKYAA